MYIQKILSNGVRVVVEKLKEVHSATIGIWVKAGSVNEMPETNGISHFIEHMLFKGTEHRGYLQISSEIDHIGGQLNAFTGKECTCYYAKVIDEKQSVAVDVLTDMLCNSVFDANELKKEKGVVLEEIKMSNDDPDDVAHEKISEAFFRGTELSKTILGNAENVQRFEKNDILRYMNEFYTTERIVVVAVGNIDMENLIADLEEKLTVLPQCKNREGSDLLENWQPKSSFTYVEKDLEQMNLCIALKGYSYLDKRKYTLSALSNMLGGSMSSRLFQKIREELGMAYSVYSYPSMYTHAGNLTIYAGNSPENTEKVLDEVFKILQTFTVTQEELNHTKAQLRGNYILSQESMSSKMNSIGKNMLLRGSWTTENDVLAALNAITLENVNDAIREIFDPGCVCGVFVGKLKNPETIRARFL